MRGIVTIITFIIAGILTGGKPTQGQDTENRIYKADITPLNEDISGSRPEATVILELRGENLIITVEGKNMPPDMMHLIHIHGYRQNMDAECADLTQDANKDGIVDLIETEAVSGITLIPFHDDPANLEIDSESYPRADADGTIKYRKEISINDLEQALENKYAIAELNLAGRVIYIHGVDQSTQLPESVRSLPDVPAVVTLPIACGKIVPVQDDGSMRAKDSCNRCR
jgi:hypothetical protein